MAFLAAHELFLLLAPMCYTTTASVWMACTSQSQPQCLESDLGTTWFFVVLPQTKTGVWRDIKETWLPLGSLQQGLWFHVSPIQVTVLLGEFYTVFMFSFLGLLCGFWNKHIQHFYLRRVNQLCRVAKSGQNESVESGLNIRSSESILILLSFFEFIFSLRSLSTIQQLQLSVAAGLVGSIGNSAICPQGVTWPWSFSAAN